MSHGTASSPSLRAKRRRGRRWNTVAARACRRRVGVGEETSRRCRLRAPRVDSLHCEVEEEEAEAPVVHDLLGAASTNDELPRRRRPCFSAEEEEKGRKRGESRGESEEREARQGSTSCSLSMQGGQDVGRR